MNTNELINAELFPRNVPKPSSFHENTLRPEVPEVSLMFENGFQYTQATESNKTNKSERVFNKNAMELQSGAVHNRASSLQSTNLNQYETSEPASSSKNVHINKQVSTGNRLGKSTKDNHAISSSDETNGEKHSTKQKDRTINTENHLIEPVESYSVWKYKNQHMYSKDTDQDGPRKINHVPSEYRNFELESSQAPCRTHSEAQDMNFQKETRWSQLRNERLLSNKPCYENNEDEQEEVMRLRYVQKQPIGYNFSIKKNDLPKHGQESHSPSTEFYRTHQTQDQLGSPYLMEKQWRIPQKRDFDRSEPTGQYVERMPYQRNTSDNSGSELSKVLEYQNKHIEFLNEQIYALTLQNKTLGNITTHVKMLEDAQIKVFEFVKDKFNTLEGTILDAFKNIDSYNNTANKSNSSGENNMEFHLSRMENRLIKLIESKMVARDDKKRTPCITNTKSKDEHESSSAEEPLTDNKHKCVCEKATKPCSRYKNNANQKSLGMKADHSNNSRNVENFNFKVPFTNEIEQSSHSKQIMSKKPGKKSQKTPEQEKMFGNPTMPEPPPVFYHQQNMYQAHKVTPDEQRESHEKLKKDKARNCAHEKVNAFRTKKSKSKPQHLKGMSRAENIAMNEEHSLTLNARELPVINEHIPSPEASVHIDMADYQSSSSEFNDSDEENRQVSSESEDEETRGPWPTFYNNVVGKVHKLLQGEEQGNGVSDDQYRTVQVRMATIDQFKKMGISFVDDSPNGKRVIFNKKQTRQNQLVDNHLGDVTKRSPLTAVCNTNLSLASLQYLQRYHLIPAPSVQVQGPIHHESNQEH